MFKLVPFDDNTALARRIMAPSTVHHNGRVAVPMKRSFPLQWHNFTFTDLPGAPGAIQTLRFNVFDLVPPEVNDASLTGFYFQLVTPKGTNAEGNEGYITLALGGHIIAKAFNLTRDINGYNGYAHQSGVSMTDLVGQGSIAFKLRHAPSTILTPGRWALDPDIVQDIVLILFYEGEMQIR